MIWILLVSLVAMVWAFRSDCPDWFEDDWTLQAAERDLRDRLAVGPCVWLP